MKWRIDSKGLFYDPGETTVIYYDPSSGDTHLLSAYAAQVLQEFLIEPLSMAALTARLAPMVEAGQHTGLQEVLEGILSELVAMDILKQD